jgi:hypothetical protein
MCNDREKHGGSRRSFLRAAGLAGAGAAALGAGALGAGGMLDPQPALAAISDESLGNGKWNPDSDSPRFTVAGSINQIWHGWIGDVRIVNRPLRVDEFMTAS